MARLAGTLVWALGAALCTAPAQARPITFYYTGVVDYVVDWTYTVYPDYVDYGSAFSGSFTFESTTPPRRNDPYTNTYVGAVTAVSGQVGSLVFGEAPPIQGDIQVSNDLPPSGHYRTDSYNMLATVQLFGVSTQMGIGFIDYDGNALSSKALPEVPPTFGDIHFGFQLSSGPSIGGYLTSFTPEPGGFAMIAFGAMAALARRRRSAR
jgi:hypothetical protein